jgi:hypothetical protein
MPDGLRRFHESGQSAAGHAFGTFLNLGAPSEPVLPGRGFLWAVPWQWLLARSTARLKQAAEKVGIADPSRPEGRSG